MISGFKEEVLQIENHNCTSDNNKGRFSISKDDRYLAYADNYMAAVIDLKMNNKAINVELAHEGNCIRKVYIIENQLSFVTQS